jgi:hypothetical protein
MEGVTVIMGVVTMAVIMAEQMAEMGVLIVLIVRIHPLGEELDYMAVDVGVYDLTLVTAPGVQVGH